MTSSKSRPGWVVHLSGEAIEWLTSCTMDQAALGRVMSNFNFIIQKIEIAGPTVGEPDIKKLIATDQLWEMRVKVPTGAYRMFFRFGKVAGHRIAAVAYGRKKSENDFPRSVIDLAQRKADAFLTERGADGFVDADD